MNASYWNLAAEFRQGSVQNLYMVEKICFLKWSPGVNEFFEIYLRIPFLLDLEIFLNFQANAESSPLLFPYARQFFFVATVFYVFVKLY